MASGDLPGVTHRSVYVRDPVENMTNGYGSVGGDRVCRFNSDGLITQSITRPIVAMPQIVPTFRVSSSLPVYCSPVTPGGGSHTYANYGVTPSDVHPREVTGPVPMEHEPCTGEVNPHSSLGHDPTELIKQLSTTVLSLSQEVLALKEQRATMESHNSTRSRNRGTRVVTIHLPGYRCSYQSFRVVVIM